MENELVPEQCYQLPREEGHSRRLASLDEQLGLFSASQLSADTGQLRSVLQLYLGRSKKTVCMKELAGAGFFLRFKRELGLGPACEFVRLFDLDKKAFHKYFLRLQLFNCEHRLLPQTHKPQEETINWVRLCLRAKEVLRAVLPCIYQHRLDGQLRAVQQRLNAAAEGLQLHLLPASAELAELGLILSVVRQQGYRLSLSGFNRLLRQQGWPQIRSGLLALMSI